MNSVIPVRDSGLVHIRNDSSTFFLEQIDKFPADSGNYLILMRVELSDVVVAADCHNAAGHTVFLNYQNIFAEPSGLNRRRESGASASGDDNIVFLLHKNVSFRYRCINYSTDFSKNKCDYRSNYCNNRKY